jgi:branched-subunit amino acid transport protein
MSDAWLLMAFIGVATFAMRLSFIMTLGRLKVPYSLMRALRYVPPAVLSAIIFPELLRPGGALDLSLGNTRLLAGLLAAVVAWRTGNVVLTIVAGMVALWALNALI